MFQTLKKKSNHNPLPYTQAQLDIVKSTEPAIIIEGVVGSGKSQILLEIAQRNQRGLYLATNKTVVNQVQGNLPINWQCRTFNSFGLAMCHKRFTPKLRNTQSGSPSKVRGQLKVDFKKPEKLEMLGAMDLALDHIRRSGDMSDAGWKKTCDDTRVPYVFIDPAIKAYEALLQDTDTISADEMLYWPVLYGWHPKKVDVLMIDNYQDLNPLQLDFIKLIPTDRIIFAGDQQQTIFQFAGARNNNKDLIKNHYRAKEYNLTESFTCPPEINKRYLSFFIPNMTTRGKSGNFQKQTINNVTFPNDCLILGGSIALLAAYSMQFIKAGVKFTVSPSIVQKLKKEVKQFAGGTQDMTVILNNFAKYEKERRDMHARYGWDTSSLDVRLNSMSTLLNKFTDYDDLIDFINSLDVYKDINSPGIRIMTIHTAKGLKHDNVFLLTRYGRDESLPDNLGYVGASRSTENLTLIP